MVDHAGRGADKASGTRRAPDGAAAERLEELRGTFRAALDWCTVQEAAYLTRGSGQGGTPIHVRDIADLLDFLVALTYRFDSQLEKSGGKKKRFNM